MPVIFPSVDSASDEGLLAVGGVLDIETLTTAYRQGIFPWPVSDDSPLTWFSPDPRGILEFEKYRIPRSFRRFLNKTNYKIKFNTQFENIIRNCCLTPRKGEAGTWISEEIIQGYTNLFNHGLAYCAEVYEEESLVGGLYGVCIGEIITGESMFHHKDNASKFALYHVIKRFKEKGLTWIDIQMVTPTTEVFGGEEISRSDFIKKLGQLNLRRSYSELFS